MGKTSMVAHQFNQQSRFSFSSPTLFVQNVQRCAGVGCAAQHCRCPRRNQQDVTNNEKEFLGKTGDGKCVHGKGKILPRPFRSGILASYLFCSAHLWCFEVEECGKKHFGFFTSKMKALIRRGINTHICTHLSSILIYTHRNYLVLFGKQEYLLPCFSREKSTSSAVLIHT